MKKLLFPDEDVIFAMKRGVIDVLTVIPPEHLTQGVTLCFARLLNSSKSSIQVTKLSLVQPKTGGILSSLRSTSCEFPKLLL